MVRVAGLLLLVSVFGCFRGIAQGADVSISVLTTDTQPVINVWNDHNLPVEAFLITEDLGGNGGRLTRIYYDVHINRRREVPVPPGASQQLPFPHIVERPLPVPELRAVVFSDGSTSGDTVWVEELLRRRAIVAERLQEVISLLNQIANQDSGRDEALALLQGAQDARRRATLSAPLEERALHDWIFGIAILNMKNGSTLNGKVPDAKVVARAMNGQFGAWLLDLQLASPHRN